MNRPGRVKERDGEQQTDDARVDSDLDGGTNEQDVLFGVLILLLVLGGMYLLASCTGNNPTGRISNFITGSSDDSATVETEDSADSSESGTSVAGETTVPLPTGTSDATMELTGTGIRLSGTVATKGVRDQIVTEAAAVFGPDGVEDNLVVDETFTDEGGRLVVAGVVDTEAAQAAATSLGNNAASGTPLTVQNMTTLQGAEPEVAAEADAEGDGATEDNAEAAPAEATDTDDQAVAAAPADSTTTTGDTTTGIAAPDSASAAPATDAAAQTTTATDSPAVAAVGTSETTPPAISKPEQTEAETPVPAAPAPAETEAAPAPAPAPAPTAAAANPAEAAARLTDLSRQADVSFDYNSANLSGTAVSTLDQVVAVLQEFPSVNVEIAGHTDAVGPADRNQRLSQERADSVRAYLIGRGIAGERLVSRGYGETVPLASSETEEGRIANRRIEFSVLG